MRFAKLLLPVLVLALLVPVQATSQEKEKKEPAVVTEKDNGGKVEIKKGETLKVRLPTRSGTLWSWQVVKFDDKVIKQEGKVVTETIKGKKALPGGLRTAVFTFKAEAAGTTNLSLVYRVLKAKDKDKEVKGSKKFNVTVTVR